MSSVGTVQQHQAAELEKSLYTRQDRSVILVSTGVISWVFGTETLTWSDLHIYIPGLGYNTLAASSAVLTDPGYVVYVRLNRTVAGVVTAEVADIAAVPLEDNVLVLCVRAVARVHFLDGTVYEDGESFMLGRGPT